MFIMMDATKEETKETSGTVAKCSTVLSPASDSPSAMNSAGCLFLSSSHRGMYSRAEVMNRREKTYLHRRKGRTQVDNKRGLLI